MQAAPVAPNPDGIVRKIQLQTLVLLSRDRTNGVDSFLEQLAQVEAFEPEAFDVQPSPARFAQIVDQA